MSSSTTQATIKGLKLLLMVSLNKWYLTMAPSSLQLSMLYLSEGMEGNIFLTSLLPMGWLNDLYEPSKQPQRIEKSIKDPHQRLMDFSLNYPTTLAFLTTNSSPWELFMQSTHQTRFDLLRPELEETVCQKQAEQKTMTFILTEVNSSLDDKSWYGIWGMVLVGCREHS